MNRLLLEILPSIFKKSEKIDEAAIALPYCGGKTSVGVCQRNLAEIFEVDNALPH